MKLKIISGNTIIPYRKESDVVVLEADPNESSLSTFFSSKERKLLFAYRGFPSFKPILVREFSDVGLDLPISTDIGTGKIIQNSIILCTFDGETHNINGTAFAAMKWNDTFFLVKKKVWSMGVNKNNEIEGIAFPPLINELRTKIPQFCETTGCNIMPFQISRSLIEKKPKNMNEIWVQDYHPLKSIGTGINTFGEKVLLELYNFDESIKVPNLIHGSILKCRKLEKLHGKDKFAYRAIGIGFKENSPVIEKTKSKNYQKLPRRSPQKII